MGVSIFPVASSGFNPTTVTLQQTITSGTSVTIPAGVNFAWVVLVGGGGGSGHNKAAFVGGSGGGGAGGIYMGWVPVKTSMTCAIGAGGTGGTGNTSGTAATNGANSVFSGSGITTQTDRKSTRLNSSHVSESRMPSSALKQKT